MRVKICGLMRYKDVKAAIDSGADAVGFIVQSPSSRRNLQLTKAKKLIRSVPVFAARVAVTSAEDWRAIQKICTAIHPDALQLYQHDADVIRKIRESHPEIEVILATGIQNRDSVNEAVRTSRLSDAILADTLGKNGMGGTGHVHDWRMTATLRRKINPHPLILAGGLTPRNVRLAIEEVRPYGVDVSSGVEQRVGVKDHRKISDFIVNAKEILN